jgi:hypothetical protein
MDAQQLAGRPGAGRAQTKAVPDDLRAQIDAALVAGRVTRCPPGFALGSVRTSYDALVRR